MIITEQELLRKAYDKCLSLKHLLSRESLDDELYFKAEQLADAIHHYIVPEE